MDGSWTVVDRGKGASRQVNQQDLDPSHQIPIKKAASHVSFEGYDINNLPKIWNVATHTFFASEGGAEQV